MTIVELRNHLLVQCPKNRKCDDCSKKFASMDEFEAHLKYVCPSLKIQCSSCNEKLARRDFRNHECYLKQMNS